MRKIVIFILSALIISSCGFRKKFKVHGQLINASNENIFLKEMTSTDVFVVDSTKIDSDGEFTLKGEKDKPAFYMLYLSKNNNITLIIKPGERLKITGDAKDLAHTYSVEGSKDSQLAKELNDKINSTLVRIDSLGKYYRDSIHSQHILAIRAKCDSVYEQIETSQRDYTTAFIKNNLHSMACLMALYQQLSQRRSVLNPVEHFEIFKMVDSVMTIEFPTTDAAQSLHKLIGDITNQKRQQSETEKKVAIGAIAPEIALPSPKGEIVKLSSTHGKYVLLDFWASWCKPCRQENPNLVKVYYKYRYQGFDIFQVSLDRNKESWLKGIQDDQLNWTQVSDLKMWDSPVVGLYGIQGIPHNLLLDPNGKIIAKDLLGGELAFKLKEIFKW
jgi:thiol-disulfide isomerase/thioredoxin